MRLTCPNCDAQYEVEATVIPEGGRDVQCSNCGHTWFQTAAGSAVPADAQASGQDDEFWDETLDDDRAPPPEPPEPPPAAAEATADDDAAGKTADVTGDEAGDGDGRAAEPEPPIAAAPEDNVRPLRRRELDEDIANVLREEAERETRARQAEGSSLETQGDLGLAAPAPGAIAAVAAMMEAEARKDDDEASQTDPALVSRTSRRELLPDIEEINSTLRATSERPGEPAAIGAPETLRQRRSGFRRGFFGALMLTILLLVPYLLAQPISARFPAVAPALTSYAQSIDSLRLWLDARMKSTTESMRVAP